MMVILLVLFIAQQMSGDIIAIALCGGNTSFSSRSPPLDVVVPAA